MARAGGEPEIRILEPQEAGKVCQAITAVYGSTYEIPSFYDPRELESRMARGVLTSAVAELGGELVCHAALTLHRHDDVIGHVGQAVTLPAARGHHTFTAVKRYLADYAKRRGVVGLYSEATATHPFSQRANLDLGAKETGYLLGFIAASVDNSVAVHKPRRQSAALFYLRLDRWPDRPVHAPDEHREMVREIVTQCQLPGRLGDSPARLRLPDHTVVHTALEAAANRATVTVMEVGSDIGPALARTKDRLFERGYDAVYVDLPLEQPAMSCLGQRLAEVGLSFAGVFPNSRARGDVLRLQCIRSGSVAAHDVTVASEHGRVLLDYVVRDLRATGHTVEPHDDRGAVKS